MVTSVFTSSFINYRNRLRWQSLAGTRLLLKNDLGLISDSEWESANKAHLSPIMLWIDDQKCLPGLIALYNFDFDFESYAIKSGSLARFVHFYNPSYASHIVSGRK